MELTADFVSRCVRNVEANTTVASSLELLQALIAALPPVEDEFRPNTRDAVLADAEDDFALTSLIVANTCTFMRDARAELIVKRKLAPSDGECWKATVTFHANPSHNVTRSPSYIPPLLVCAASEVSTARVNRRTAFQTEIDARLGFLAFAVRNSGLHFTYAQLADLWSALVDGALSPKERESFFEWLGSLLPTEGKQSAIVWAVVGTLFSEKLCSGGGASSAAPRRVMGVGELIYRYILYESC